MYPMYIAIVAVIHLVAALLFVGAVGQSPTLAGFAGLAYMLGMRHGFDADHIVAIDGTTRGLLARGRDANGVGLFFSLGHSTVVMILALWVAHATQRAGEMLPVLRAVGGDIGLAASSVFMLLTAALNIVIFRDTLHAVRHPEGNEYSAPPSGGLMWRIFGRVLRTITRAPQMYFVGFVFGLGFDTASEIALLAISATAAVHALPLHAVLVLPLAFASGMALVDTAEGMFMVRAYGWAQDQPVRRLRYNLVVTGFTIAAALTIGAMQLANFAWSGVSFDSTLVGVTIVLVFPLAWLAAAVSARLRRRGLQPRESAPQRPTN
jgi:high-affinity nickel-transport protein